MGTHAGNMLHRVVFGSVTQAVVEHASCPVLLVPCARVADPLPREPATAST